MRDRRARSRYVLCGGDGPPREVTEQDILDLEREAFLAPARHEGDAGAHRAHAEDGQAAAELDRGMRRAAARTWSTEHDEAVIVSPPSARAVGQGQGGRRAGAACIPVDLSAHVMREARGARGRRAARAWTTCMLGLRDARGVAGAQRRAPRRAARRTSRSRCRRRRSTASARPGCRPSPRRAGDHERHGGRASSPAASR